MRSGSRTSVAALGLLILTLSACDGGARLVQRTENGGVVIYPFKESGSLLSPFRRDAMRLMEQRCGGPYRVVREGETKGRNRISESAGGMEMVEERRWGIEFVCKSGSESSGP